LPIKLIGKEYKVLIAQLESLFLSSSSFTLQTLYYHLHPTIHTMSLLSSLCLSLETEGTSKDVSGESESSDDDFGGKADELGLGGAALKGIMDVMNAKQGVVPGSDIPAGEVIGGEVLGIICERESTMSGYVLALEQVRDDADDSDPTASTLHTTLLEHASQPYSRMLIRWISTGYLSDPFDEFMVKESTHISKSVLESDYTDEYWERRYTVCHQVSPDTNCTNDSSETDHH
jgi:gamma-tubulin complex component 2